MVVIEPVPITTEEKNTNVDTETKSELGTPSSSATNRRSVDDRRPSSAISGYASDGYETASETELNNDTEDEAGKGDAAAVNSSPTITRNSSSNNDDQLQEQLNQQQLPEGASHKHTSIDEELAQKALAEANEAKLEGNKFFKDGLYEEALSQYELALQTLPEIPSSVEIRSIFHANRAACFFKLGKNEDTIKECTNALKLNSTYVKALLRRAEAHEKLEHYEEAIADITKILEMDPSHDQARRSIIRLKPLADDKREKMKEEMIGKLKDMGNSILGRFGMSVDNFKTVKDPNTSSYSISFQS